MVKSNPIIGTSTAIDGKYSLSVPDGTEVLIFTFIGMKSQEVLINGRSVIDVQLEEEVLIMDEVVVLGYTTRGKNEITGSTVQITTKDIANVPVVSVDQTLQGKVAGLTISTTSGTPGSQQNIRIRGVGSITAGNEPLYVIDGVPVVSGNFNDSENVSTFTALSSINANDIASITILKDASATSAFGARGSNGVIVITTKSGKKGDLKFNFSSTYGFQNKATNGKNVLSGAQREELYYEGIYNTYGVSNGFTEAEAPAWALANGFGGAGEYDAWRTDGAKEGNWEKALANEDAPIINVNISATGGNEKSSFYASLGYNSTEATVQGSEFNRTSGTFNFKRDLADNVKFSTNNSASNTFQRTVLEQSAYFGNPHAVKYFMSPLVQPYNDDGTPAKTYGGFYNPLVLNELDDVYNEMDRFTSNNSLEWEIIENLKYKTTYSLDYMLVHYKSFQNSEYADGEQENGSAYESNRKNVNYVWQNSLDYRFDLNASHHFAVKALMEYQKNERIWLWGSGENFPAVGLTWIESTSANQEAGSSFEDWANLSYLGMLNYNFEGKYIADVTYRREGSSRFALENRYGNFWSIGLAWNISQESFFANIDLVNKLRVRGSYGTSGSSAIAINSYQPLMAYDSKYNNQGAPYPSQVGNAGLSWEKNNNYDVGLDFGILDNKISGSFAYFNKNTYDLLQDVPLTFTSGFNEYTYNIGEMNNKGIEILLDIDVIRSDDFNLSVNVNYATVQNEVTALAKDPSGELIEIQTGTRLVTVGQPVFSWNMRKWAGVDPANGDALWYLNGIDGETTNDYYAAEEALQEGSAMPTYSGGFGLHADYKGVFLDVNFAFAGGHKVYEDWAFYTHHSGRYTTEYYQGVELLMDRWQQPGDVTDVPRQEHSNTAQNASRTSSRFLFDGDYIRLKDLVIGYNIPESVCSKIKVDGISVFARGTNIWTWIKDEGLMYDPEIAADGFTGFTTPPIKSFVFGLNLNF